MEQFLSLKELGSRLYKVDMLVVALLKRRMDLALQVGEFKVRNGQKIFRASVESKRLAQVKAEARKRNLSQHFAASILYQAINESCKQQMIQLQNTNARRHKKAKTEKESYRLLKKNLLLLTRRWADSYDDQYDKAFFATHAYLDFEDQILEQEIRQIADRGIALDLGCATGRLSTKLSPSFRWVYGYDLSPHMLMKANAKEKKVQNVSFIEADLEKGIPQSDSSVSFVAMNLGTASDIRDISGVLKEVKRVLVSGGRFFFSFYNREALLYQWDFIPWPVGLAAEINIHKHCLDVHLGAKVLSVYARPYTSKEARNLFPKGMKLSKVLTHPTISSILPNNLFEGKASIQKSVADIDRHLAKAHDGAYIIVTGKKM
ncbi:methyltransferase domain-containing protein [Candidatus Azambacteria bacterium]|nr:methyltransferase domain-containing protein [Candidatus Azambacteria bacterium]